MTVVSCPSPSFSSSPTDSSRSTWTKSTLLPSTHRRFHFQLPNQVPTLDRQLYQPTQEFQQDHPIIRKVYEQHHGRSEQLSVDLEYSIHQCPARMYSELSMIFPELFSSATTTIPTSANLEDSSVAASSMGKKGFSTGLKSSLPRPSLRRSDLLIVPTFQKCEHDLVASGPEQDREKDLKLEWVGRRMERISLR